MPYDIDGLIGRGVRLPIDDAAPKQTLSDLICESMRDAAKRAVTYTAHEVCMHSFVNDSPSVCMACGVSVVSARIANAKLSASVPVPGDHAGWDKLKAALAKCEPTIPSQPMSKTEAQLHHLTSVFGSREKALDHWKECHLAERAKRNAREHADYNDSAAMTKGLYEHGRAQELEQAMSRPLAAEKSMRAQILLREDD